MDSSGLERRTGRRFNAEIEVEWESVDGRFAGVVADIGLNGCFVLCSGPARDGQAVKILVPLDGSMNVEFAGEVVNSTPEIGFAVRFREISQAQIEFISSVVEEQ